MKAFDKIRQSAMWPYLKADVTYRFVAAFTRDITDEGKARIDKYAGRTIPPTLAYIQAGLPYNQLTKTVSWVVYYALLPIWRLRGYSPR